MVIPAMSQRLDSRNSDSRRKMPFTNQIARACLLSLLAISFATWLLPLRAQEQPATPPKPQQQPPKSKESGFARQLTHETREAAGEEEKDENAQFKESPSVQFIARHTGLSTSSAYFASIILNFAVIAGIIFWSARKYLPGAFSARTAAIQKAMREAQKASDEARRRLADIENRLMKLDGEIGMMRDQAEREAAAEEARIQAAAEADAKKIIEAAQQEIASAAKAARRELTAYAADLAVGLAQKQIRVDAATDQSLVRDFAGELGGQIAPQRPGKDGRKN
jgi:F-type H+-transporting ATPase subunit b